MPTPEPLPAELATLADIVQMGDLAVILGLRDEDEKRALRYRFVRADVEEGFRQAAQESTMNALRRLRGARILQYDSSHMLDDKEVFQRRQADAGLDGVADVLSHPASRPSASFRDFDHKIDFYAFVYLFQADVWPLS